MPSYRRSAASLDELREQVLLAFGPEARIVEATRVTRRGVGRWLARDEIEATVDVPEGAAPAGGVDASRLDRSGIAALLADADDRDGDGDGDGDQAGADRGEQAGADRGEQAGADRGELHLGDLIANRGETPVESALPAPAPRARRTATSEAPTPISDDAPWRAPEAGSAENDEPEPLTPSTAAPAFAALLAAVERSLGVDEPPTEHTPLLALPAHAPAAGSERAHAAGNPRERAAGAAEHATAQHPQTGGYPRDHTGDDAESAAAQHAQTGGHPRDHAGGGADTSRLDRSGIAALLADGDPGVLEVSDLTVHRGAAPAPHPRTRHSATSEAPTATLDDALRRVREPADAEIDGSDTVDGSVREGARAAAPAAGDLVLLVGLGDDAVRVAREISGERGWPVSWVRVTTARSGARAGNRSLSRTSVIADRRAGLSARTDALRLDREVLLAHAATLDDTFAHVTALRPDRVWAVVDASRSAADTAEWVGRLDEALGVDALAIIGTAFTRDRDTAARLGFPVAWQEPPEASA